MILHRLRVWLNGRSVIYLSWIYSTVAVSTGAVRHLNISQSNVPRCGGGRGVE
jgi:hypothetical protein